MIKKSLSKILVSGLVVLMVGGFAGCGSKSESASNNKAASKVEQIKKSGKLVVGTSADYPPYEFHKSVNGKDQIVGFDIKIAEEIAKDLGVKLEIKDMKFDGLLAALQSGNVDMVLAGMNATEERKKSVDFSEIYYKSLQSVIVRAEDKDKIKTVGDLKGKKVGAQKGTTQEGIVKDQITGADLKALGKVTDLMLEIKNKKVDALVVEQPVGKAYVSKNSDLAISDINVKIEDEGSAVAVKKGSSDLVEAINKTLDKLMKDKSVDKFVTEANEMVE